MVDASGGVGRRREVHMSMRQTMAVAGVIAAVVVLAGGLAGHAAPQAPAKSGLPRFEVDPAFLALSPGKLLGDMSSVAVDSNDHVWMIHRPATVPADRRANAASPVLEFEASGKF